MPSEISTTRNVMLNIHCLFSCEVVFLAMAQCLMLLFLAAKMFKLAHYFSEHFDRNYN